MSGGQNRIPEIHQEPPQATTMAPAAVGVKRMVLWLELIVPPILLNWQLMSPGARANVGVVPASTFGKITGFEAPGATVIVLVTVETFLMIRALSKLASASPA